jgi:hypothetical protein
MNKLIPALLLVSSLCASAQQAAELLDRRIAFQKERYEEAQKQLVAVDARIEKSIASLLADVAKLTDSKESGTRIAGVKKDVIDGLRQSLEFYKRERDTRIGIVIGVAQTQTTPDLSNDVKAIEARMDKRVEQIVDLSTTFAQQKGYQQYERYSDGDGGTVQRESEAYRHNEREVAKGSQQQRHVIEALRKSIDDLQRRNGVLKTQLAAVTTAQDKGFLQGEIDRNEELMNQRREQVREVIEGDAVATKELSRQAAFQTDQLVDDQMDALRRQFQELKRAISERDLARSRLRQLQIQREQLR